MTDTEPKTQIVEKPVGEPGSATAKPHEKPQTLDAAVSGIAAVAIEEVFYSENPGGGARDLLTSIAEGTVGQEKSTFDNLNNNILNLVNIIESKENPERVKAAKNLLKNLLQTREQFYLSVAQAINPNIWPVEGKLNVYQVGEGKIYGSVIAALDATPTLESHRALAEALKIRLSKKEQAAVIGEELPPKKLIESAIVYSGSSAQSRIQPFGADIDMAEHIRINAETSEKAADILAQSIKESVDGKIEVEDNNGNKITLHFLKMKVGGNYPADAAVELQEQKLQWSITEIKQGHKEYENKSGQLSRITLEEACKNPQFLKVDYVGITDDTVVEVTKVSTVIAKKDDGTVLFDNSTGQAAAFQEIYFDDPSGFGLLEETSDPDKFLGYIKAMREEMKKYNQPDHLNKLKVLKRMYNLLKTQGDLLLAQELSDIFSSQAAAAYQLSDRLGMTQQAEKAGINVDPQKKLIEKRLIYLGLSEEDLTQNIEEIKIQVLQMTNIAVEKFIAEHPNIQKRMEQIITI